MFYGANDKFTTVIIPQSVATSATASGVVDTLGADYCQIIWNGDTASTNPVTLDVAEGDTTSAYTAIGALTGDDTTDGFTIPAVDTSNGIKVVFNIDCRKRKRHLRFRCNPGATQVMSCIARLGRRGDVLATDADMDADEVLYI